MFKWLSILFIKVVVFRILSWKVCWDFFVIFVIYENIDKIIVGKKLYNLFINFVKSNVWMGRLNVIIYNIMVDFIVFLNMGKVIIFFCFVWLDYVFKNSVIKSDGVLVENIMLSCINEVLDWIFFCIFKVFLLWVVCIEL